MSTATLTPVKVRVEYDMFGDMEPAEWAELVLRTAKDAGKITDYKFIEFRRPKWVAVTTFEFTADLPGQGYREFLDVARDLANEIVGDTDARIVFLVPQRKN